MTFGDELRSRNFSIYAQWLGVLSIFLCVALGIANLFNVSLVIIFSIICLVTGVMLVFVEIPFLTRICPTSEKFDGFVRRFDQNWPRAAMYLGLSAIQFCSLIFRTTSLIAAAVVLLLTSACYGIAGMRGQEFQSSSTLGGHGVASQMIV